MKSQSLHITRQRDEIITLLTSTQRPGMNEVIAYLDSSGYFTAPSSENRHHNWLGGLAQHSLGVCKVALNRYPHLPKESIIIASLLHDLCKARQFAVDKQGRIYERRLHIQGHGRRSVWLIEHTRFHLTGEERTAILSHMHKPGEGHPLWQAIYTSDRIDAKLHRAISPHALNPHALNPQL